ncbi:uncharacterized protein KZ484_024946 [Pholidichthys leucotaenia]
MKNISIFCCLLYAATLTEGDPIYAEGSEGEDVSFQCAHKWAETNIKYFCKDPCKRTNDTLVTVKPGSRAESGKITLVDFGNGVFRVNISQLKLSDSQTYWCAVKRSISNTYTEVRLAVKKAVRRQTTVIPIISSTWLCNDNCSSTAFTTDVYTSSPVNYSTASNSTNEEPQNIGKGIAVYMIVGCLAVITVLIVTICLRKCRKTSKHQQQVCSNSIELSSAHEREVSHGWDGTDEEMQWYKKLSECTSVSVHHTRQDPPTFAPRAVFPPIYENIPRFLPADHQDDQDVNSEIYINPLPDIISERMADVSLKKHLSNTAVGKNTQKYTSSAPSCESKPCSESTEEKPRTLWFGLDLSGIN